MLRTRWLSSELRGPWTHILVPVPGGASTRRALITGITGQDGSYLAEFLLAKGYEVTGIVRPLSTPNLGYLAAGVDHLTLLDGDLMERSSINQAIKSVVPDEVYNLAAQSSVGTAF